MSAEPIMTMLMAARINSISAADMLPDKIFTKKAIRAKKKAEASVVACALTP
jgi:hypothetical protein